MISLPPLNSLRAFDAAGRHLNFRLAADELGVTQAAVAQHVRLLEDRVGMALFERRHRGVAFTASGRGYYARISAAFEELRAATAKLRPEPGSVLISVTPTFAAKWLIPNLSAFSATHADIDLRILATESVSSFHGSGIDLAVRQGEPPFGASLNAELLFRHEVIAVAAPGLVNDVAVLQDGNALASLPKIHDSHDLWPDFLKAAGVECPQNRGLRLSQTTLAIDAAREGQGVALVSRFLVETELKAGHLVQITDEVLQGRQGFYLLSRRQPKPNKAVHSVINWLSSRANDLQKRLDV